MNIEIITTPNSTLNETGFGNFDSCQNVMDSITKMGHECKIYSCDSLADLERILERKPDLAVLAVKSIAPENSQVIWLSEFLEKNATSYTGSTKNVILFDSDKVLAKQHLQKKGISTASFFTAYKGEFTCEKDLPLKYPLFLKPSSAANSNGIDDQSHVSSFDEFERKVSSLQAAFNQPTLAEEYMSGSEYTVSILTTKNGEILVSAIEVIPPKSSQGRRILSKNIKSDDSEILKKITDKKIHHEVRRIAFEAFMGIGAEGFARIDIKANASGKCFFMEVNLVPGMTIGSSYFPEAFRIDMGLNYDQVVTHIVDYSLSKEIKARQRTQSYPILQTDLALSPNFDDALQNQQAGKLAS